VIGLFSGTVTTAARHTGHVVSFAITGAMMILVNAFMVYTLKKRRKERPRWRKYGPLACTLLAAPLVMADLLRHLLNDYNLADLSMYNSDNDEENLTNLTVYGWLFTIIFTYLGFILLFIGVLWNANILEKLKVIRTRWRELRENYRNLPSQ